MTPEEVKQIRAELGWTQKQLADALGVWIATVSRWEHGAKMSPMAQAALRLLAERKGKANV